MRIERSITLLLVTLTMGGASTPALAKPARYDVVVYGGTSAGVVTTVEGVSRPGYGAAWNS